MAGDPVRDEAQDFRIDGRAGGAPVTARADRIGVRPKDMAKVASDMTFEPPADQLADRGHIVRRYLKVVAAGDRQDRNRHLPKRWRRVVANEVAEPSGIHPRALDADDVVF